MSRYTTITQRVHLAGVTPQAVYDAYLNAERHAAFTGQPAEISAQVGAPYQAYGGYCHGRILHLEPGALIVSTWRAANWPAEVPDGVVTFRLEAEDGGTALYLSHAVMPAEHAEAMAQGWHDYYWAPLQAHFGQPAATA